MIQQLRKKFIHINMVCVMLLLFVVLFLICFFSYDRFQHDSLRMLQHSLDSALPKQSASTQEPPGLPPDNPQPPDGKLFVFTLKITDAQNYKILSSKGGEPDEAVIAEMVPLVLAQEGNQGVLSEYGFRYMTKQTEDALIVSFADTSAETDFMKTLVFLSVLVFCGSTLVLYVISCFLARWALKPVELSWKQQRQFVADASHELKTPLTVILANLNILRTHQTETIASQERWLVNTQSEAVYMKKLVEDLLFLARSDADSTPSDFKPQNISDLMTNRLLMFEPLAFESGISLSEDVSPNLWIQGDEVQITQLFSILLENACKYAELEKRISVYLHVSDGNAVIEVSNTCTDLSSEDLSHLFERFFRSEKSRSRKAGGYGLGLSIADVIVKHHHGKISAKSENGITTFTVILPLIEGFF